jgi:hypothetical protein
MEKQRGFAILHLRFAIQDAFFSILIAGAAGPTRAGRATRRAIHDGLA